MDQLSSLVALVCGLLGAAIYGWYLWVHCGLRELVKDHVARYRDYEAETERLNRMWDANA